jgi:hypothetical protein
MFDRSCDSPSFECYGEYTILLSALLPETVVEASQVFRVSVAHWYLSVLFELLYLLMSIEHSHLLELQLPVRPNLEVNPRLR